MNSDLVSSLNFLHPIINPSPHPVLPVVDLPVLEKRFTSCEGLLNSVHLDKSFQNLVSALNQSKAMADLSLKEKNDSSPLFEETTPKDFQLKG